MAIVKINKLSKIELRLIKDIIAEAFVTNELFHNWGSIEERYEDVLKYMRVFVTYVYKAKQLYANDSYTAFIALEDSKKDKKFLKLMMLIKMLFTVKWKRLKALLSFSNQVASSNARYAKTRHIDCQMLCVKSGLQGQGLAKEMVEFAKYHATKENLPLLVDTDMQEYKQMYEHLGLYCYNKKTATNGVTRYSLIYKGN